MTLKHTALRGVILAAAIVAAGLPLSAVGAGAAASTSAAHNGSFNSPRNLLISDQYNNRAIEVNPVTKSHRLELRLGEPDALQPGARHHHRPQ
jgi:hypothetical protein